MIHDLNTLNTIKRLAWVTDIHLDFLEKKEIQAFCHQLIENQPDALLIGGDIGDATSIFSYLKLLGKELACQVYFVLGNHDYYYGSISSVRKEMETLSHQSAQLHWLPATGIVRLTDRSCLIGHGCWADGRLGDYQNSTVLLNDYVHIKELSGLEAENRLTVLNYLGDEAAAFLRKQLLSALKDFDQVYVLTHVPPCKDACKYQGEVADDNWLPHFSCQSAGTVFLDVMKKHPDQRLTVLCGHTHHSAEVHLLPNLLVKTGQAKYGKPELQETLLIQ